MSQDERSLFGDEQAYIASRQHLAELERDRRRKEILEASRKRRPPKMGPRSLAAWRTYRSRVWRARVYLNPAQYETYKQKNRESARRRYHANTEEARKIAKRSWQKNRVNGLLRQKVYYREHASDIHDRNLAYYRANAERLKACSRQYYQERGSARQKAARNNPEYRAKHAEYERARLAANQASREKKQERERSPEYRAHRCELMRRRYQEDPAYREKVLARNRARCAAKQRQDQSPDAS